MVRGSKVRLNLKVLLVLLMVVLGCAIAGTIIPILVGECYDSVDRTIVSSLQRGRLTLNTALRGYFASVNQTGTALRSMFNDGHLTWAHNDKVNLETTRQILWSFIRSIPHSQYVYFQSWPGGEYVGYTQPTSVADCSWFYNEGIFVHDHPCNPYTGEPDFTVEMGYIQNATKLPDPLGSQFIGHGVYLDAWGPSYVWENILLVGRYFPVYHNGVFVGEVGVEVWCSFLKNFLSELELYPSEEYFIIDITGPGTGAAGSVDEEETLMASSNPSYSLISKGRGKYSEEFARVPFKNYTFDSRLGPTEFPAVLQGEVERRWGNWTLLGLALANEKNATIVLQVTHDSEVLYVILNLYSDQQMRLVLCGVMASSDLTGSISRSLLTAIVVCIVLSAVLIVLSAIAVAILLRPLGDLARMMDDIQTFRFDHVWTFAPSILSEVYTLQRAFTTLSASLQEYKAFLPKALFAKPTDEPLDPDDSSPPCSPLISPVTAPGQQYPPASPPQGSSRRLSPVKFSKGKTARFSTVINERMVTVLATDTYGFEVECTQLNIRNTTAAYYKYVSVVNSQVSMNRGTIDRIHGSLLLSSWDSVHTDLHGVSRACTTAHSITLEISHLGKLSIGHLGIGLGYGRARCGYWGSRTTRTFMAIGTCTQEAIALSRVSSLCRDSLVRVLINHEIERRMKGRFHMYASGVLVTSEGRSVFFFMSGPKKGEKDWMYDFKMNAAELKSYSLTTWLKGDDDLEDDPGSVPSALHGREKREEEEEEEDGQEDEVSFSPEERYERWVSSAMATDRQDLLTVDAMPSEKFLDCTLGMEWSQITYDLGSVYCSRPARRTGSAVTFAFSDG
eukprot:Sspe_Gene.21455::Locus_8051_Transcript_1_1_Confidence_1.000_Length_2712::g.21455::m.21455